MAIELVTGKAGVPHVDSEDVGAFNAYSLGSGAYIMSGCEVMAKSANSVNIAAGEILWEGRHIRVKGSGESLAVDNGQTGYNRRDLITLNYAKDPNGIESVSFAVVKGTATTGTAADPSVKVGSILAGDTSAVIPFARITLSGLSVATPTVLLGSLPSLVSLRDSVSHGTAECEKRNISSSENIYVSRFGSLTVLWSTSSLAMSVAVPAWGNKQIATIPVGYRPASEVRTPLVTDKSVATMVVKPNGEVYVLARAIAVGDNNTPTNITISAVYPVG